LKENLSLQPARYMRKLFLTDVNYEHRVFGLDLFRATAILLVVYFHSRFLLEHTPFDGFPWTRLVDGVELFFVLSGFLIGSILIRLFHENEKPKISALANFWKRRWFRTLPAYFLVLLLNILFIKMDWIGSKLENFNFSFFFFLQNFSEPFTGFFWESWSLSIEEWFYIFFPVLFFVLRIFIKNKYSFLISIVLMIVLPLMYRISISDINADGFNWDIRFRKTVLCRLDAIIYGALAAWIKFYYPLSWKRSSWFTLATGIIATWFVLNYQQDYNSYYMKTFYFSLIPLCMMLFLPAADSLKKSKGIFRSCITHISLISYSMYLIHLSLVAFVILHRFMPETETERYIYFTGYWLVTILASALLYKYFEKLITGLREK